MRLLLAIDHPALYSYIEQDSRINVSEIVHNVKQLYDAISYTKADVLVLSRYLNDSVEPKSVLDYIQMSKPGLRIIYLYGAADDQTEELLYWLKSCKNIDCHVGSNITSVELNRLLFGYDQHLSIFKNLFNKKTNTRWLKELDTAVIAIYSNSSNGKSHFAWNLTTALNSHGYKTTLLNLDRGYSANIYFGIEDIYYDLLSYMIALGDYKGILDSCYKKDNLSILTGRLGDQESISSDDFIKLLYFARSRSDIVVIDTHTGLSDITLQAINNSTIDFLVYDSDLMHFHMNQLMLDKLGTVFVGNKTYALINNCNINSESYKYIYRKINKLDIKFKYVLPISSCGSLSYDLMSTGKSPYEVDKSNSSFYLDFRNVLHSLKVRSS